MEWRMALQEVLCRSSAQRRFQADWLQSACSERAVQRVCCNSSMSRHTHTLSSSFEGIVMCVKCWSWSGGVYRALKSKCKGSPTTGLQRLCLRRLAQGLSHPGLDHVHSRAKQSSIGDSLFVVWDGCQFGRWCEIVGQGAEEFWAQHWSLC